jgi:two-component system cell cycle sensor histidine kinase/response regulator CckA
VTTAPAKRFSTVLPYFWALILVLACGLARWFLGLELGLRFPFITLFFAVFFSAWIGGFGPALFATVTGLLLALFFFFPNIGHLPPFTTDTTIGAVLFLLNGIAVGWIGEVRLRTFRKLQQATALAEERGKKAEESSALAEEEAVRAEEEFTRAEEEAARAQAAALQAGRESERANRILESIADGFYSLDRDWRFVYVNRRAAEAMKRPRESVVGLKLWDLFPQLNGSVFQREFERAMRERKPVTIEEHSLLSESWLLVRVYPTEEGLSIFFEDVTAKHVAAIALQESEERLRLATDVGKFGIWDWDMVRNRVSWSPRLYEFHGISREQFGGTVEAFRALVHPADAARVAQGIKTAVETHSEFQSEFRTIRPDGEIRWLLTNGRVVYDADGKPIRMLGATQDVTQRREGEERLRQAQRIDAAGRIAGGVAHEVNNQMTVVLGLTEFMLRSPELTPELRADTVQIRRAGERSALITSQLLAFSRRQVLWPTLIDLNRIITDFERVLRKTAGEETTLILRLTQDLPLVLADRAQMEQVLLNLTLNAGDALQPNGGTLTIETSVRQFSPDYIAAKPEVVIAAGPYVMIAVTDTGTGMTPDVLSHVFEPFYTTKPVGQGSGLGLSSVYGIVKQSNGYIWVYSEPGLGSTFKIYLPVPRESPSLAPAEPASVPAGGRETILVVEDEPDLRGLCIRMLQEMGYQPVEAANGREGLAILRRPGSRVDLVLTDIAMPVMGGGEFGSLVAREFPGLPVLYMSGYTDADIVARGLLEANVPFIQKPFTPDVIAQQLRNVLDGRSPGANGR